MAGAAVISLAYLAISWTILGGVLRSNQLRTNPLAVATGLIFFSCGVGHFLHGSHAFLAYVGFHDGGAAVGRQLFSGWEMWGWEIFTGAVAVWYWSLRHRFPALLRGTALFEDMRQRQREALQINDNIVQGLAKAKLNFELGRTNEGMAEIEATLKASRTIISSLVGPPASEKQAPLESDLLRRTEPARLPP